MVVKSLKYSSELSSVIGYLIDIVTLCLLVTLVLLYSTWHLSPDWLKCLTPAILLYTVMLYPLYSCTHVSICYS